MKVHLQKQSMGDASSMQESEFIFLCSRCSSPLLQKQHLLTFFSMRVLRYTLKCKLDHNPVNLINTPGH